MDYWLCGKSAQPWDSILLRGAYSTTESEFCRCGGEFSRRIYPCNDLAHALANQTLAYL